MDTYQPGRVLGQGSFGKVYEAMNMATGEMVAIKRIELKAGNDARAKQILEAADAEITMMRILRHPNVVSVQGCWIEHDPERPAIMIVMQLVPGRSIADLIKTIGPFHELVVRRFTKQLLQALEYCHSLRAVHRDIKGERNCTARGAPQQRTGGCASVLLSSYRSNSRALRPLVCLRHTQVKTSS